MTESDRFYHITSANHRPGPATVHNHSPPAPRTTSGISLNCNKYLWMIIVCFMIFFLLSEFSNFIILLLIYVSKTWTLYFKFILYLLLRQFVSQSIQTSSCQLSAVILTRDLNFLSGPTSDLSIKLED